MDQQSFEATRPVSADPAVALAEALGQLPKVTVKPTLKAPAAKPHIVVKTS
ncbi:MAG: DNA topoisomerase IB, partial [Bradyrhizobium sp.]|nr:DNA topoisomerase IB [Bradyrhizobium sp.]